MWQSTQKAEHFWGYQCFLKSYGISKLRKVDLLKYFQFHFSRNRSKICKRNEFKTVNVIINYLPNNKIER